MPTLDPKDAFLLGDVSASNSFPNGSSNAPATPAHVPWLRKTEYLSREASQRSAAHETYAISHSNSLPSLTLNRKHVANVAIDVSRAAQLRDIEASFFACNDDFSLKDLHHPNKPGVTAIESYEVLPDADIWPNQYDLFRFSERPGERPVDVCFLRRPCL